MKSFKLIISQEAADEIELSYHYYENRSAGLGDRFKKKLDDVLTLIRQSPDLFDVVEDDFRQAGVRVFPFVVVFEIVGNEIRVYSVFHTSRNPKEKFKKPKL